MRSVKHMPRPNDLSEEAKKRIQELLQDKNHAMDCEVKVNFKEEYLEVTTLYGGTGFISFEAIGKMIGLINYAGATVRKK